jgi:glycerol-3-phosphate cytidylyltransferase-like family protein
MVLEKCILTYVSENITSSDEVTDFEFMVWLEVPVLFLVEAWKIDTSWDENGSGKLSNFCEWSLNSVKNCLQNT